MKEKVYVVCRVLMVFGALLFLSACSSMNVASVKPNIILISSDDLGHMDIQEYAHHLTGEKKRRMYYETPNLDRLCSEGICFEEAYASSGRGVVSPPLLAGGFPADKNEFIGMDRALPDYDSAFIGRWSAAGTPESVGFAQKGLNVAGRGLKVNGFTEQVVEYIEGRTRIRNQPFFLYINHPLTDESSVVDKKDIAYFSNKRTRGWNGQHDPLHAGRVKALDDSVGTILHKLWRTGLDEHTIVIFMPTGTSSGSSLASKAEGSRIRSGGRVPLIIRWNKYVKAGSWSKVPVDYADILPTVVQCAGHFPEKLCDGAGMDGCSLSGLFWDPQNKAESYERDLRSPNYSNISASPVENRRL